MSGRKVIRKRMGTQAEVRGILRAAVAAAALAALVLVVYGPVTGFEFVNVDDPLYISDNPLVKGGLSPQSFLGAFTTAPESYWGPLTWLSYMVDVDMHGFAPGGFHLTNLLLHLFSVVLFFVALRLMTGDVLPSFGAAALLAVHPLHVESVAWLAERKDVLAAPFFMLVLLTYVGYVRRPDWRRLAAVTIFLALGLMAKPMLITAPAVLLILDWWPLGRFARFSSTAAGVDWRSIRPLLREKAALILLSAAFAAATFWTQRSILQRALVHNSMPARLANAVTNAAGYLARMVWPAGLAPTRLDTSEPYAWWQVAASILLVMTLTKLALKARSAPFLLVGWLWYGITLLPVSGILQWGIQQMADHFAYLPFLGIYLSMSTGLGVALRSRPGLRGPALAISTAVLAVFVGASRHQVMFWRDSESLNRRIVEVNPADYDSWSRLGVVLAESGRVKEALPLFERAVRLNPSFADGRYNLGFGLLQTGRNSEAIGHLRASLALQPDKKDALFRLAEACERTGDLECAVSSCRSILGLQPDNTRVRLALGRLLEARGRREEAMTEYARVLQLDPGNREASLRMDTIRVSPGEGR